MRILKEAEGMRKRGHEVILAVQKGGGLVEPAKKAGFTLYEITFQRRHFFSIFHQLQKIIRRHKIQVVNTHSSLDAWIGGMVAKCMNRYVIRTRHLSTPIRKGPNSWLLYNVLTNQVVTTCAEVVDVIERQANLKKGRCSSVPTGIDPENISVNPEDVSSFRERWGVKRDEILVGTLCVLRGWKGVADLLQAAKLLEKEEKIRWMVIGSGASEGYFKGLCKELGLEDQVIFTGFLASPYAALAALDIFVLLSWAHEGVSQASLQAAFLKKPLVTTPTGGLKEICLDHQTGIQVPCCSPEEVAKAVLVLAQNAHLRQTMGEAAHRLVNSKFLFEHTLNAMEKCYDEYQIC